MLVVTILWLIFIVIMVLLMIKFVKPTNTNFKH